MNDFNSNAVLYTLFLYPYFELCTLWHCDKLINRPSTNPTTHVFFQITLSHHLLNYFNVSAIVIYNTFESILSFHLFHITTISNLTISSWLILIVQKQKSRFFFSFFSYWISENNSITCNNTIPLKHLLKFF